MQSDRPSFTATVVSFARGLASAEPGASSRDPLAGTLLPPPFAQALRALAGRGRAAALARPVVRSAMLGLVEHLELRTAMIDDALRAGVAAGCRQLVILGAGLDSRAFRLRELAGCTVFEIDHPATQAYKRSRIARDLAVARELRFVAVDFEREELGAELAEAGHDATVPTFWIWEGVVPYLNPAAIDATLAVIAGRSAPGSRLAVSYGTPGVAIGPGLRSRPLARLAMRAIREPLLGLLTPAQLAERLRAAGFTVTADHHPFELSRQYRGLPPPAVGPDERVAIAERKAPAA